MSSLKLSAPFIKICGGSISNVAVQIENLSVRYPASQRPAVDRLTLNIPRGAFFGLLGPNGSGKTTLLSFLCGQISGQYKTTRVLGVDRAEIGRYKMKLGYAPQEIALYTALTARANLLFFADLLKVPSKEVDRVLEWIGLADRQHDLVGEFSGGMKRRLNLGVALLNRPELLILDEPTVGVDPQSRNFIFDHLLGLKKEGLTLIYSTHYLEEVEKICDRVGILQSGRMLAEGPMASVLKNKELESFYLDLTGREVE